MATTMLRADTWDRIERAEQLCNQLLISTTHALHSANIDYAIIGGLAVHHWVSTVAPIAARSTPNVMIHRRDYQRAVDVLCGVGYEQVPLKGQMRLVDPIDDDYPKNKRTRYVSIHFCNEMVNTNDAVPNPGLEDLVYCPQGYWAISLKAVTTMKLNAFRLIDQVHLIDLLQNRLINESWVEHYPPPLSFRLNELCELPEVRNHVETEFDEEGN